MSVSGAMKAGVPAVFVRVMSVPVNSLLTPKSAIYKIPTSWRNCNAWTSSSDLTATDVHVLKQHSSYRIWFLYFRVKNEMNVCSKGLSVIKTSTCTSICMCIISIILMIRPFFFFEIPYTYSFINTITNTSKCLKSSISKKNIIGIYCIKRQRLLLAIASFSFNRHSMP